MSMWLPPVVSAPSASQPAQYSENINSDYCFLTATTNITSEKGTTGDALTLFLQLEQKKKKEKKSQGYCCVKRRKAADVKENLEYGGGEVHERVSVCDLLSCSSLEGTVKYLMLSEDQQEPVNATALWAKN